MRQPPLLDPETYSFWPNICTVGLQLAASCAQAGFLDWASNLDQLRHLKAGPRGAGGQAPLPPRRPAQLVRRLFIWGFIGANTAITIAWAQAADEAAAAITTAGLSAVFRRTSRPPEFNSLVCMVENVALSAQNLCQGRWWTLLTCCASHHAPSHLLVNMFEFYTWTSRCFDLGVGPASVAGLMLGSAVCSSMAGITNKVAWQPGLIMGASGIVCGLSQLFLLCLAMSLSSPVACVQARCVRFAPSTPLFLTARLVDFEENNLTGAAAILLEPMMSFRVPHFGNVHSPLFLIPLQGFVTDLIGVISQRRQLGGLDSPGKPGFIVGHDGHLGGAAFGLAYWYLTLRPRFGTW